MANDTAYDALRAHMKETALLGSCGSVLGWDERTYMPREGGSHRADQLALLAGMVHDRVTDERVGAWLGEAEASAGDPLDPESVNWQHWRRSYDRETKLPKELVEALARITSHGQLVWEDAREANDYSAFKESSQIRFPQSLSI